MEEELQQKFDAYSPYLDDIRKKVLHLVLFFIFFFIAGFFLVGPILKFIITFFKIENVTVTTTSPFQFIDLAVNVGMLTALIFCTPIAVYYIYSFLSDGLHAKEKKFFFVLLPIGLALFLIGFSYGFAVLYYALNAIAAINITLGVVNLWAIDIFLSQITLTAALLGIIFQFPIALTFLIRIDMINIDLLKRYRRHAIAAIFVLTSLLPPTDGLSLLVMVLPLVAMYELTILANRFRANNVIHDELVPIHSEIAQ